MARYQLCVACVLGLLASSVVAAGDSHSTFFLQSPDFHGGQIVFVYDDELWLVAAQGGTARRLTDDGTPKYSPRFSPDGRTIAYSARRRQNLDVFTIAAQGGASHRVTWHPGEDRVEGWTRDGREIIFSSDRANFAPADQARLFLVSARGGLARVLPMHKGFRAAFSPDGRRLAYTPVRDAFQLWKRYRGGETTPIWLVDLKSFSHTEIPHQIASDTSPVWLESGVYFRSDRSGVMSIHHYDERTGGVAEIIRNGNQDIESLGGSGRTLVYGSGGLIFTWDRSGAGPRAVPISIPGAESDPPPMVVDAASLARTFEISADGKQLLFEARGDLFVASVNAADSRNLTSSSGIAERTPTWSSDGSAVAYQSDEGGEYRLYVRESSSPAQARIVGTQSTGFVHQLRWSPDAQRLAYINRAFRLCWVTVAQGRHQCIDSYVRPDRAFVWAPDGSGIFYAERLPTFFHQLRHVSVVDARVTKITDGMGDVRELSLSADTRHLFFLGSADVGPAVTDYDYSRAMYRDNVTWKVYGIPLAADDTSPFAPESTLDRHTGLTIDVAGMGARIASSALAGRIERLAAGPGAQLYLLRASDAALLSELRTTAGSPRRPSAAKVLERFNRVTGELEGRIEGVDDFDVSAAGAVVLLRSGRQLSMAATGTPRLQDAKPVSIGRATAPVDWAAERNQIFREAWRMVRDYFYDERTHGVNWTEIGARYARWLPDVRSRAQLDFVLQEMLGELVNSHLKVVPAPGPNGASPDGPPEQIGLLGADFRSSHGRYQFATVYPGSYWGPQIEQSPLALPGVQVRSGEYLLSINGRDLRDGEDIDERLAGFAGKPVELRVGPRPALGGSRLITVTPLASELRLRQRTWVDNNKRLVEQWSDGRIAYLYQPDTSGGGLTEFIRYFFPQTDRAALLIDERFNSGGADPDYQLDVLSRTQVLWYSPRDLPPFRSPLSILTGPKAMLVNSEAGSGGDVYPYQFKRRGLGTVIGMRTWGGVQGGYRGAFPATFVDGGAIRIGDLGTYSPEGRYILENSGFEPDIIVPVTPADDAAGVDPQLRRAVEHLLSELEKLPQQAIPEMERVDRSLQ